MITRFEVDELLTLIIGIIAYSSEDTSDRQFPSSAASTCPTPSWAPW